MCRSSSGRPRSVGSEGAGELDTGLAVSDDAVTAEATADNVATQDELAPVLPVPADEGLTDCHGQTRPLLHRYPQLLLQACRSGG